MNLKELAEYLKSISALQVIKDNKQRIQFIAMSELEAAMKSRVFIDGQDSKGSLIGNYSTAPSYVSIKSLPKLLPTKGKQSPINKKKREQDKMQKGLNKAAGVEKKANKTLYLSVGYKELRGLLSLESGTVNLFFTGASEKSLKVGSKGDNTVFGFSNAENQKILEANEKKFGKKIFTPSEHEIKLVNDVIRKEVQYLLKRK